MSDDKIRTLDEILAMLKDSADTHGYFEIGPEEAKTLQEYVDIKLLGSSPVGTGHIIFLKTTEEIMKKQGRSILRNLARLTRDMKIGFVLLSDEVELETYPNALETLLLAITDERLEKMDPKDKRRVHDLLLDHTSRYTEL